MLLGVEQVLMLSTKFC